MFMCENFTAVTKPMAKWRAQSLLNDWELKD